MTENQLPAGHENPPTGSTITLQRIAIFYLFFSTLFSLAAFPNFHIHTVVLLELMMAVVPMTLLVRESRRHRSERRPATFRQLLTAATAGFILLLIQLDGLVRWASYFANFSLERLAAGGGYHRDSAFHVAFIQNILATGRPSTGQHLDPIVPYHFLSYYFDAAILRTLRLDAWESYALLFFGKSTLLILSILFFLVTVNRYLTGPLFWISASTVALAYTSDWSLVGSHTQWIPTATLLLVSPWIRHLVLSRQVTARQLAALTALVVWLTFGKGSIGIAFAVVVGILLAVTRRPSLLLVLTGALWALFFAAWGLASGGGRIDARGIDVFRLIVRPAEDRAIVSVALLVVVLAAYHRRDPTLGAGRMATAMTLSLLAIVAFSTLFPSGDDFYYFALALFLAALVTVFPWLSASPSGFTSGPAALALAALVAITPMTSTSTLSPYGDLELQALIYDANLTTFDWLNEGLVLSEEVSVLRLLRQPALQSERVQSRPVTDFERLRNETDSLLSQHQLTRADVFLFIPSEVFEQLETSRLFPGRSERDWRDDYTGLLMTAVTGLSLVHGVREGTTEAYGFGTYLDSGEDVFRRRIHEMPPRELCAFGRAVLVLRDFDTLELSIECTD